MCMKHGMDVRKACPLLCGGLGSMTSSGEGSEEGYEFEDISTYSESAQYQYDVYEDERKSRNQKHNVTKEQEKVKKNCDTVIGSDGEIEVSW